MEMMMQQMEEMEKKSEETNEKPKDLLGEIIHHAQFPLIVITLSVLFNLEPVCELFKFGGSSFFFDGETNKFTMLSVIVKALLIGIIFFGVQFAINK